MNDADDAAVSEEENCRRHDVVPDEHDDPVGAVHCPSRPLEVHTLTIDHLCRRPCRDEVATASVDPRQNDSGIRHPATVVVPVDNRVNYLDVALDSDHNQTED